MLTPLGFVCIKFVQITNNNWQCRIYSPPPPWSGPNGLNYRCLLSEITVFFSLFLLSSSTLLNILHCADYVQIQMTYCDFTQHPQTLHLFMKDLRNTYICCVASSLRIIFPYTTYTETELSSRTSSRRIFNTSHAAP